MTRLTLPNNILIPEVERLLAEGSEVTMKVKGNSMLPFIVGDRDSVVLTRSQQLQCGDIILVQLADGRYILHRIISLQGDSVTLQGDGNLYGTEHCRTTAVIGKVTKIVRNGRYVETNSFVERCKSGIWKRLRPIRRYILAIYRRIN